MRPGTDVINRDTAIPRGPSVDTGTAFFVGEAEYGPTDRAVAIRSMAQFQLVYGSRQSYGYLYDAVETFLREGGSLVYVVRVVGPAAVKDTLTLADRAGTPLSTLTVTSIGHGAVPWSVEVLDGATANTFVLKVWNGTTLLEQSLELATPAAAVQWASTSNYVRIADAGSATAAPNNNPAVIASTALATGSDDRASITDAHRVTALSKFLTEYGVGQVAIPGSTTSDAHAGLFAHAAAYNRTAIADLADTANVATLTGLVVTQRAAGNDEHGGFFGGAWPIIPGLVPSTYRTVPPSALVCGLMARNDKTRSPGQPAAGSYGEAQFAYSVSRAFTDAEHTTLNEGGVNLIKTYYGTVQLYGYRSAVNPNGTKYRWLGLNVRRVAMRLQAKARIIGDRYVYAQIDGQGRKIAEFGGALRAMLQSEWLAGALYGATAEEAYTVDVDSVNTPESIAAMQLRSAIGFKPSPMAEQVVVETTNYPVNQAL